MGRILQPFQTFLRQPDRGFPARGSVAVSAIHRPFARIARLMAFCAVLVSQASFAAPDEELLGKSEGYPIGTPLNWFYEERVRVGSFSHLDRILPHNLLRRAAFAMPLGKSPAEPEIRYLFQGVNCGIEEYLERQRVTGLLILRNGEILVERYQYDRQATDRFVSHSMAKSITSLAVGFALEEGRIRSLDDKVSQYVSELQGYPYGETSIRNVLRMSSGVRFTETYDGKDDLARFAGIHASRGAIEALRAFVEREAPEGSRFHYASSETVILALLIRAVTGETLSRYLEGRLWQPMGAESDATWVTDPYGLERAGGSFSAVLRDYGRLGVLLANDGSLHGRQILPKDYLLEATDWRRQPEPFAQFQATPYMGYGYQFWTFPGPHRRFALLGVYGQAIFVEPELKLVMVQTAAARNASVGKESMGAERFALWKGVVNSYGKW